MAKKRTRDTPRTVKVISIQQPFADMIIFSDKWCENRTWRTQHRGELFIHASKWSPGEPRKSPGNGHTGKIIGKVNLVDCVDFLDLNQVYRAMFDGKKKRKKAKPILDRLQPLAELVAAQGWTCESFRHACGDWCFLLTDRTPLAEPIPAKGRLNLWQFQMPKKMN